MSHMRKDYGSAAGFMLCALIIVLVVLFAGCSATRSAQSWDQENLKRSDHGCPSAVYTAPDGNLVQCQQEFTIKIAPKLAPPEFATIELAALAGFNAIAEEPTSTYYEWGGLIMKMPNGMFAALGPNTDYAGDHVNTRGDDFGLNGEPAGSYHTHPCLPRHYSEYFSPPDLNEPLYFHRPAFMGDLCTGNVHEFKPGDKPDVENPKNSPTRDLFLTKGRIIGKFTTPHVLTVVQ